MAVRIKDRENLLRAHRRHIYQLLANEKGIPHWKVSVGYGLFQVVVGLSVLCVKPFGLFPVLCLLGAYFLAFTLFGYAVRKSVGR
jgi:Fuc2NAc and GlcNAc transferase